MGKVGKATEVPQPSSWVTFDLGLQRQEHWGAVGLWLEEGRTLVYSFVLWEEAALPGPW